MADVAADIEGEVATDGAGGRGERVGGAEDGTAGLDGVTAFPDHGADGAGAHVWDLLVGDQEVVLAFWERGLGATRRE